MPAFDDIKSRAAGLFELEAGSHRILPMEGMRGISALMVFFVHFHALFGSRAEHTSIYGLSHFMETIGNCGVDVFFALSGFIIYGLLLNVSTSYFKFVRRRIRRLYPTFIAVYVIYVALSFAMPAYSKVPKGPVEAAAYLAENFLLLPGVFRIIPLITVAWSLSYELFFYLTLPLLIRWLRIARWARTTRVMFFLSLCVGYMWLCMAGFSQHSRAIMFGCGILMRETFDSRIRLPRVGDYFAVAFFAASMIVIGVKSEPIVTTYCGPFLEHSSFTLVALFLSVYILGCFALGSNGPLSVWLSLDWIRWFGNISYSYYLTHALVLHFMKYVLVHAGLPLHLTATSYVALFLLTFVGSVAGACIVFLAVEKRFSFPAPVKSRRTLPVGQVASVPAQD
jgi:exopolysaccharide production protein ExoZ